MPNKLIILQGPPASGKSTWARQYLQDHPETFVVSRDSFRDMNFAREDLSKFNKGLEAVIVQCEWASINAVLTVGWDCIVDATNLKQSVVNELVDIATDNGAEVEYKKFDTDFEQAVAWDQGRVNAVGANVLKSFYDRCGYPTPEINEENMNRWSKHRKCFLVHLTSLHNLAHMKELLQTADVVVNTANMMYSNKHTEQQILQRFEEAGIEVRVLDLRQGYIPRHTRRGRPRIYVCISDEKNRLCFWQDHHDKFARTETLSNEAYQDGFIKSHWTVLYQI